MATAVQCVSYSKYGAVQMMASAEMCTVSPANFALNKHLTV